MFLKYLYHMSILILGVALITYGVIDWYDQGLTLEGLLLYDNGWRPHPIYLLTIGLSMVPMSMWEIFVLETQGKAPTTDADQDRDAGDT